MDTNNGMSPADVAAVVDNRGGYGWGGYPMMGYPVMPMMGGYGGGWGNGFGGDWSIILILFLFAAMGGGWGNGFGGFAGFGGDGAFPWLMAGQAGINANTNDGFNNAGLASQISGLRSDVTSGFSDVQLGIAGVNQNVCQSTGQIQNSLCSGFANTTAAVTGAQNALSQQLYTNEIASLNRSFAEQTANTQAINGVSSQLAQCLKKISHKAKEIFGFTNFEAVGTLAA